MHDEPFCDALADAVIAVLVKPRKNPQPPKQNREMYHLARAIAKVCKIDYEANKGRLFAEAKRLAKADPKPTPELVYLHYGPGKTWYQRDWRGRKGNLPTLGQVRLTWTQMVTEWQPQSTVPAILDQSGLDAPNPLMKL